MIHAKFLAVAAVSIALLTARCVAQAPDVVISEILTQNTDGLKDEEGDTSSWVELYNATPGPLALQNWSLTAHTNHTARWVFPEVTLGSGEYRIVFVSGKNHRAPDQPLHTDFKLEDENGYLALLRPDRSVASALAYGAQRKNLSYGIGQSTTTTPLVGLNSPARVLVPADGSLGLSWTGADAGFNDSTWTPVRLGIGFDLNTEPDEGLLGFWDFDDATSPSVALDLSRHSHTGKLAGGAVYTADARGRTGSSGDRAMSFGGPGTSARVVLTDASTGWFDPATANNQLSVSCWIFGGAVQPAQGSLFWGSSGLNGSGARSAQAHLPWSDQVIYWDTGGTDSTLHRTFVSEPDSTKWKGRWNHYVFLKDGPRKEIWQNGTLLHRGTSTAALDPIRSFYIGSGVEGQFSYGGLVDDFAIWGRALLPEEIAQLSGGASPLWIGHPAAAAATDVSRLMHGINSSVYLRSEFQLTRDAWPSRLRLHIKYADGFIAYLNGVEVARRFAPPLVDFAAAATTEDPGGAADGDEQLDLTAFLGVLKEGRNFLTFQALNGSATDAEFLLEPTLLAGQDLGLRYFTVPSPGAPNDGGESTLLSQVQVSHRRGFYAAPFTLRFWVPESDATLRFTLDGSEPGPNRGTLVNGTNYSLTITQTTLLRVRADRPGALSAPTLTHTYLFPGSVAQQVRPGSVAATWPGGFPADFAIDPRVVDGALPTRTFTNALLRLPSLSIATPLEGLFGSQGIYANASYPKNPATDLEIPISAELMFPDGADGFQEDAGFEIHGNITRDKNFTPKHSFNLIFRAEYGSRKLRFPMFQEGPVTSFDRFVLRAGSTDTWPTVNWDTSLVDGVQRWVRDEASYVRDQWVRDAQLALGQQSARGTFVHLYLSGIYWGIYNLCEHPDDHFAADYYGGSPEDYDVLADFAEVHAGTKTAWDQMNNLAAAGLGSDAAYQRIQGNNPDGSRNFNYPVLLDVTNLVDYMILHVYIGADDWPNHNWWAARKHTADSTGFKFFAWDQEISINSLIRTRSSWGSIYAEADVPETPTFVYARCRSNAEFRQLFADRIQLHLFNQGALTVASNLARWNARISEVEAAVVAESARWGDYRRPERPYTREVEFLSSNAWMQAVFFPSNQAIVMKRFRDARVYPNVGAPSFSQFGGLVAPGYQIVLTHTNTTGTLFYTRDGSDPRIRGGAVSPKAQAYAQPISIQERTTLKARTRVGTNWSAIVVATFVPTQDFTQLAFTEVMYHPRSEGTTPGSEFEFLELKNKGGASLDLSGLRFSSGIGFTFTNGTRLAPGQIIVLARNPAAFRTRYPEVIPFGQFDGRLADEGETLQLDSEADIRVGSIEYHDAPPWPKTADGFGFSLVPDEAVLAEEADTATAWRASSQRDGSPGRDDPLQPRSKVQVSEVMANGGTSGDWVELANPAALPADVSGWYLTDDPDEPAKFRLPANQVIPAHGFLVIPETDLAATGTPNIPFGLGAEGDAIYLFSADADGQLTGWSHGFRFEASDRGVSFIQQPTQLGEAKLADSLTPTPGAPNAPPRLGPVILSEIHYHPEEGQPEFIELHNLTPAPVRLAETNLAGTVLGWRLRGLDFEFPTNATLPPDGRCLILNVDKAAFLASYSLPSDTLCFGPAPGTLQDSGERLELVKPSPHTNGLSFVVIDSVRYNDRTPWPPAADGGGPSLHRREELGWADDPANWVAARPTPGTGLPTGLPPRFLREPVSLTASEGSSVTLIAEIASDGTVEFQWQREGVTLSGETNATLRLENLSLDQTGRYRVSAFNEVGGIISSNAILTVNPRPFIYQQPQDKSAVSGSVITLAAAASGTGTLRYQWWRNDQPISNATNATWRIPRLTAAEEGEYFLEVRDDYGTSLSRRALVQILVRVTITAAPGNQTVVEGDESIFRVEAGGTLPIRYQWKRGAITLLNTNAYSHTSTLVLSNVKSNQTGSYSITLNNPVVGVLTNVPFQLLVLGDRDGDRLPDVWEASFGLDPSSPLDAGFDPDRDGFSNREEYQAGTNPRDAASQLRWQGIQRSGASARLSFEAISNRTYSILFTDQLPTRHWQTVTNLEASLRSQTLTVEDRSVGSEPRYYRLLTPAQP